jgi:hypothetical protein
MAEKTPIIIKILLNFYFDNSDLYFRSKKEGVGAK